VAVGSSAGRMGSETPGAASDDVVDRS